jgi:hypothetical protein
MKAISIVTLLSVAATAAAPGQHAYHPAVYLTSKSVEDFASCFTRSEDRRGRAWWFVPRDHGGTFSNLGAKDAPANYFLAIDDRGAHRQISLDQRSPDAAPSEALSECV